MLVVVVRWYGSEKRILFGSPTREVATYNCPWTKTSSCRYIPARLRVWPCDLFIVIANATWTGNWRLRNGISEGSPPGIKVTRGSKTILPTCVPVSISQRNALPACSKRSLVPFSSPRRMLMFRKSNRGHPVFSRNWCTGKPLGVIEFKNSAG